MIICESYMTLFEFSASKGMEKYNNDKKRIWAYILALIVKKVKFSVMQGKVVTILNIIKH